MNSLGTCQVSPLDSAGRRRPSLPVGRVTRHLSRSPESQSNMFFLFKASNDMSGVRQRMTVGTHRAGYAFPREHCVALTVIDGD